MTTVARQLPIWCDDPTVVPTCTLSYDLADPCAITMTFENHDGTAVPWTVARELFMRALLGQVAGELAGNVMVTRLASTIRVHLRTEVGAVAISFSLEDVSCFYALTVGLCRPGDEFTGFDLDAELERLLEQS